MKDNLSTRREVEPCCSKSYRDNTEVKWIQFFKKRSTHFKIFHGLDIYTRGRNLASGMKLEL